MPARIKHMAIVSENYTLEGRFYEAIFSMKTSGRARPEAAAVVSDGYVGMNINPRAPGRQAGFDHFGFEVDSVEEIEARIRERYPMVHLLKRPSNRPFAGISMHDPAGNVFDLSQAQMANRTDAYTDAALTEHEYTARIRHFMLRTVDPDTVARFYREVFDFHEEEKALDDPNHYLSDGRVTLVVAPWRIADYAGSGIERPALDHLGFAVDDLERFQA